MKYNIKRFLKIFFPAIYRLIKGLRFLYVDSSYLNQTGFMDSLLSEKIEDKNGDPIPWMNYNVCEFLRERLNKNINLFEYGAGASTSFYCKYAKRVTSVENNRYWYEKVKKNLPSNSELLFREFDVSTNIGPNYITAASDTGDKYDVIVIDGKDRVNCVKSSINSLSDGGVFVLDDSSHSQYIDIYIYIYGE